MFTLNMDCQEAIFTLVNAAFPENSKGVFTVPLVLKDHGSDDEVFCNMAFMRGEDGTKVLSSLLSDHPNRPTDFDLWGLEADRRNFTWVSGVDSALRRAVAWLQSRGDVEVQFNGPALHPDATVELHSENIYRITW